jgi:hypothetical protein
MYSPFDTHPAETTETMASAVMASKVLRIWKPPGLGGLAGLPATGGTGRIALHPVLQERPAVTEQDFQPPRTIFGGS